MSVRESRVLSAYINNEFDFLSDEIMNTELNADKKENEVERNLPSLDEKEERDDGSQSLPDTPLRGSSEVETHDEGVNNDISTQEEPGQDMLPEPLTNLSIDSSSSDVKSPSATRLTPDQTDSIVRSEFGVESKASESKCNSDRGCSTDSGLELNDDQVEIEETSDLISQSDDTTSSLRRNKHSLVSTADTEDDEDVRGVYDESFRKSKWIFVRDESESPEDTDASEDVSVVDSPDDKAEEKECRCESEAGFTYRRSYKEVSFKRVQRKSSVQKFARINTSEVSAEKLVVLSKTNEEEDLGFHILDSHPTVVSTVVAGSVAERAGIVIGDVILAINYNSVLHLSLSEIAETLRQAQGEITLELCKESSFTLMGDERKGSSDEIFAAHMYKLTNSAFNIWKRRWFVLKSDNCLYYYKDKEDSEILGAIPLSGYLVQRAIDLKRPRDHSLKLMHRTKTYYFAALSEDDLSKWAQLLNRATMNQSSMDNWIDMSSHNVGLPALSIRNTDCDGFLYKMGGHYKSWKRRYCVLKDGCLFYYCNIESRSAQGVAHLHGYRTNDTNPSTNKRNAFDLIPPETKMRTFHFYAETELDRERWIRAMKLSIGRWVQVT